MSDIEKHVVPVQELVKGATKDVLTEAKFAMADQLREFYSSAVERRNHREIAELAVFIKEIGDKLWTMGDWKVIHRDAWLTRALGTELDEKDRKYLEMEHERATSD